MNKYDKYDKFLVDNFIPYKKNLKIYNHNGIMISNIDYVIPGAIINIRTGDYTMNYKYKTNYLIEQLDKQLALIPKDFKIYNYFELPINDPKLIDLLNINLNTHVISDLNSIKFDKLPYYIDNTTVARSMGVIINNDSWLLSIKNSIIYIDKKTYMNAICIMSPEEFEKFSQYNLHIVNEQPSEFIIINHKNMNGHPIEFNLKYFKLNITDYNFKIFQHLIIPKRLTSSNITMLIDGVTYKCDKCNKLLFINSLCYDCNPKIII